MMTPVTTPTADPALPLIVDLNAPMPDVDAWSSDTGVSYRSAWCLAILDGEPLAKVHLPLDGQRLPAAELAERLWQQLEDDIVGHRRSTGGPVPTSLPVSGLPATDRELDDDVSEADVTVVVATRDRATSLQACLASVFAGSVQPVRLIVVDNAPSTEETAHLVADLQREHSGLHYVREPKAGLARAHNAALPAVSSRFVVFTDDDVLVDRHWLRRMVLAFSTADSVACVTGMIAPRELATLPQQWVEGNVTYDKGLTRRVFDTRDNRPADPLFPFTAGAFGSGANMGFRTDYLRAVGGFDEALGAGTYAMGGDDLAAFFDVVTGGHQLVYEPAAIVLHQHHSSYDALKRQTYGYGAGLGAHLTRSVLASPTAALVLVRHAPRAMRRAAQIVRPPRAAGLPPYPRELSREQWRGLVSGPFRFLRSRTRVRRATQRTAA